MLSTNNPTKIVVTPSDGLADCQLHDDTRKATLQQANSLLQIPLSPRSASDLEMIANGAYSPLTGFLGKADYERVVNDMHLVNGLVWPIPITLPVDEMLASNIKEGQEIALVQDNIVLAIMEVAEKFTYDKEYEARQVYTTTDSAHPGVAYLNQQSNILLGGDIKLVSRPQPRPFPHLPRTPAEVRREIEKRGWRTVAAFQTRNPVHRAHEYMLKHALEITDGLLLHPMIGETQPTDIPAEVRIKSYEVLIHRYYPRAHVFLGLFPAAMRFAGPREALFHAICRKNYGCTHFIVGNDHAGVGNYYPSKAACEIFNNFSSAELGITPLLYPEKKFYCPKCDGIGTPKTCPHGWYHSRMSSSQIRKGLAKSKIPPAHEMRPEVSQTMLTPTAISTDVIDDAMHKNPLLNTILLRLPDLWRRPRELWQRRGELWQRRDEFWRRFWAKF